MKDLIGDQVIGRLKRDAAWRGLAVSTAGFVGIVAVVAGLTIRWGHILIERPGGAVLALLCLPLFVAYAVHLAATALGFAHALWRDQPPLRVRDGRLIYLNSWVLNVPVRAIRQLEYEAGQSDFVGRWLRFEVQGRFFAAWVMADPVGATVDEIRARLNLTEQPPAP